MWVDGDTRPLEAGHGQAEPDDRDRAGQGERGQNAAWPERRPEEIGPRWVESEEDGGRGGHDDGEEEVATVGGGQRRDQPGHHRHQDLEERRGLPFGSADHGQECRRQDDAIEHTEPDVVNPVDPSIAVVEPSNDDANAQQTPERPRRKDRACPRHTGALNVHFQLGRHVAQLVGDTALVFFKGIDSF